MRLTLRTLLAYLDDTLDPAEAKLIGEKVAESDVAPELIERIKKVTRRRGLAAPPVTGDGDDAASDPNTVAEYIDNALPPEQIGEIEEAALSSDSHLAEISACHQILTLVLGEPAKVPPTARQRMYRLIKGPEAIPYRKTTARNIVAGVADPNQIHEENHEADEALLLGMTSRRMLVPIAAAVVILLLLIGVIMLALPTTPTAGSLGFVALDSTGRDGDPKQRDAQKQAEAKKKRDAYEQHIQRGRTAQNAKNWDGALEAFRAAQAMFPGDAASAQLVKVAEKGKADADAVAARQTAVGQAIERARAALKEQRFIDTDAALAEAARIDANHVELKNVRQELEDARHAVARKKGSVDFELAPFPREAGVELVTPKNLPDPVRQPVAKLLTRDVLALGRRRDTNNWERIVPLKPLNTADTIMALPGNIAEVRLDTGVVLTLWGSLPQYQTIPVLDLQESRIVPHVPPRGFDGDFTLESGRVFITRPVAKGERPAPARVRVRFKEEVWEITLLDADTEVCVDLLGFYPEGVPFSKDKDGPAPKAEFYFGLLQGKAGLRVKFKEYPMLQAPMRADWDSIGGEFNIPERINRDDMAWWSKAVPDHEGAKAMQAAVAHYIDHLKKSDASLETVFNSAMNDEKEQPNRRAYAVHCLQAIDSISFLADALDIVDAPEVAERSSFVVRGVGIRCVQHWTGQTPERDLQLFRLLIDKKGYAESHALMVMQLLHPFREDDLRRPEIAAALFEAMRHERVAIRELAYLHLLVADPVITKEIPFIDMSLPEQIRDPQIAKWKASYKKRVIDMKK
jgi:hypothetical protein